MLITYGYRVIRAILLDASIFEQIEHDRSATPGAYATVLLASLAAGVGASGWQRFDAITVTTFMAIALIAWFTWAAVTLEIGARLMPEPQTRATYGELLRPLGFAAAPGLFMALAAFPWLTGLVLTASLLWMLAAMVLAVRQALDYTSTTRAIAVCLLGWVLALTLAVILGLIFSRPVS
jgi:hypothetical protein